MKDSLCGKQRLSLGYVGVGSVCEHVFADAMLEVIAKVVRAVHAFDLALAPGSGPPVHRVVNRTHFASCHVWSTQKM